MGKSFRVKASARVDAPADVVYGIIADYRRGHPQILPQPYFEWLEVERGGRGEGTVLRFQMRVLGRTRVLRAAVTEPEPGRVIAETYDDGGVTTFTVTPEGSGSRVRIETTAEAKGIQGLVARLLAPRLLRPLFTDELARLDQYTQMQT